MERKMPCGNSKHTLYSVTIKQHLQGYKCLMCLKESLELQGLEYTVRYKQLMKQIQKVKENR